MKKRTLSLVAGSVLVAGLGVGTGVAVAANVSGDEHETPITGAELEKATAVALATTGGGRVTGSEVGDEESYYQVEVTLADGRQVDVQLDESFNVVGSKADVEDTGPQD